MIREIKSHPARADGGPDPTALGGDATGAARQWLLKQARAHTDHGLRWLLAHADDGVIWGRFDDDGGALVTSHEAARGDGDAPAVCPPLRTATLQQARLFGAGGELLLWREGGADRRLRARLIHDTERDADWQQSFDERQMLWGTGGRALDHGFFFWKHGAEGLRHALPFPPDRSGDDDLRPRRLVVRHYLSPEGPARVVASRLVRFHPEL